MTALDLHGREIDFRILPDLRVYEAAEENREQAFQQAIG
jgi:hypothetical protein